MIRYSDYFAASFCLFVATFAFAQDKPGDIFAANKKLGRGINFGNALEAPKEGDWGVTLKAEYFQAIKQAGFDTVRLPVKFSAHAKSDSPFTIDKTFAERIDWAVDQALKNKLNIIVDFHHYSEMDTNPDKHLSRLVALWEQIAERYKDRGPEVYFEILNEPHEKLVDAKWNAVIAKVVAAIRKNNPTRPVIVGPPFWNGIWALDKLQLPNDRNLIVTVHFYDPFQFTHQGASFVKDAEKWKGRKWPQSPEEEAAIRKSLDQAAAWGKKHDRPIFLGEFGVYQEADMDSRARWIKFVTREAEKRGFSWSYWEFCAGFGAYDSKTEAWRPAMKAALIESPNP